MRALITGGAGFVGSHLADTLLAAGHEVFVIDDLSTGAIENIQHLQGRPDFHYVIDTVTNEPLLAELIDRADVVFHLAAAVGVKKIVEEPVNTIECNVHGTEVVLKHANKKKRLVVIASTSEVYGKSTDVPFRRTRTWCSGASTRHRWAYACSKLIDEFLALAYWKERKLPVIIVRLFNTVGPRQTGRYGMVIPTFVKQALDGPADHRLRRRHAVAQLHLRRRRGRRAAPAGGDAGRGGAGVQHRQRRGDLHPRPGREGQGHDGVGRRPSRSSRTTRRTRRVRGHAAAGARHHEDPRARLATSPPSGSTRSSHASSTTCARRRGRPPRPGGSARPVGREPSDECP